MDAFYIILTGSLVAVCGALLGCFLVLRQMAMVGDAISHAVLPGIVVAFLLTGERSTLPVLLGAGAVGLLTTFLIEFFHRRGGLQTDASVGVVFTWLFAVGVILISAYTGQVDLDQDCVLYGEIIYVPLDRWVLPDGTDLGPRTVWTMGGVLLLIVAFVVASYKELFLTTFDPAYATAVGVSTALWHYLLMGMVSLTTVAAFESVGAILVVAFLVVPAATAHLLTDRLPRMLALAAALGVAAAVGGYYLAAALDGSVAGAMATVAGLFFVAAFAYTQLQKRRASLAVVGGLRTED